MKLSDIVFLNSPGQREKDEPITSNHHVAHSGLCRIGLTKKNIGYRRFYHGIFVHILKLFHSHQILHV